MLKKLFMFIHNHTSVFTALLFVLIIPAMILNLATEYACILIIIWVIVNVGYSENWHK